MIELVGVTVRYGGVVAVEDVTFTAPSGEVTGLIGPNGAGKSTTLRLIAGLERPSSGTVTIDGRRYGDLPNPGAAIGVLLDAEWVAPSRTAREHLRWMAAAIGLPDACVAAALDLVGLELVADRPVGGFSLGMRQRLAIAGAVLGDPPVIVLDEPVNGLDPEAIAWIRRTLRALADEGRTVLLSSHLLSELEQTADRIVALHEGRVVADAPLAELVEPAPPGRSGLEALYFSLTGDESSRGPTPAPPATPPRGVARRSVTAEARKALTSRGFRAALGGATAVALAVAVVVGVFAPVFHDATVTTAGYGLGLVGGALIAVAGALLIGLDRDDGTLALSRILIPRPLVGYASKAVVAAIGGAGAGLAGAASAVVVAAVTGVSSPATEVVHLLATAPIASALLALSGLAVGHLTSSTTAAVGIILGWWFLVEAIAVPALPFGRSLAAWLPATSSQLATIGVPANTATWSPWVSLTILAAWTAVASAVALAATRRWPRTA
ncbi:ABC transporter ATP-binding protein [Tsukamurella ocularis]|uniref:ABC transporter ATP-binding protein n=1 Tax=Tsukamurella ocularis TaxID=1970234 RepID=UPI002167F3F4|nr:ATP-binding cassette domain-containing protein [Tsukamurella ocularis]MCS3780319.1 ABC-2 type transport system ATP-binding protein [Tsukamurella ocularis]MCS3786126.1 ABC-2 type transport system ATP-binding protein [Tsukamurella ocularis]MCS3849490.1 ABC-2 type transport system ATP-binding protein [Tsukamurella ocularis]